MKIAIQMDPLGKLQPKKDSTLMIASEALARGYEVYHYSPQDASLLNGKPTARMRRFKPFSLFDVPQLGAEETRGLTDFNIILLRQNPPFDMAYFTSTYLLEEAQREGVLVSNHPATVRNHPEKLLPLQLAAPTPSTLISRNADEIRAFHKECGEMVLKPLYGFGGESVFHVNREGANLNSLLEVLLTNHAEPLVAQRFVPGAAEIERRVTVVGGKVIGMISRVPTEGEIRSNTDRGATAMQATLSESQQRTCDAIARKLDAMGIFMAGIDMLGDDVLEVNITSPGGFVYLHQLYNLQPQKIFWDALIARAQ